MSDLSAVSPLDDHAPDGAPGEEHGSPVVVPPAARAPGTTGSRMQTWFDRVEAFISRLSVRDNFWHRVCSLIWLPYAFFSGIKMKQVDATTFSAILPFRRFNRNWYHAMAGGALLANSEIAGGMYVFGIVGENYTVVCRHLDYRFLRPCYGPAVYRMLPRQDIHKLIKAGGEFDILIDLDVQQQVNKPGEKDKRIGRCAATFHVTPKEMHKARAMRHKRPKRIS